MVMFRIDCASSDKDLGKKSKFLEIYKVRTFCGVH